MVLNLNPTFCLIRMPEPYVFRGGIFSVGIGPIPNHPAPASRSGQDSYVSKGGPFWVAGDSVSTKTHLEQFYSGGST